MVCTLLNPTGNFNIPAPVVWEGERDAEGHRTYKVEFYVQCTPDVGPATALQTPGLPLPGSYWQFGSDLDVWAWCLPTATIKPKADHGHPNEQFSIGMTFSTKPPPRNQRRCQDQTITDPLLEPPKINGKYQKYNEETSYDRFGIPLLSSSFEQFRGSQVEFDKNRGSITIEQNCATPQQGYILPAQMLDTLNQYPLWGLPPRCIKLSEAPWERVFYGLCEVYYKRTLTFDLGLAIDASGNIYSTFDRNVADVGTKALNGAWGITPQTASQWVLKKKPDGSSPNSSNPGDFNLYQDRNGNTCPVLLNGRGIPAGAITSINWTVGNTNNTYIAVSNNVGSPPPGGNWILQVGGDSGWDAYDSYVTGNVVLFAGDNNYYIAQSDPSVGDAPPSGSWLLLPNGVTNGGNAWNTTQNYVVGDSVSGYQRNGQYTTQAGWRYVQKYNESDFTKLLIPLTF